MEMIRYAVRVVGWLDYQHQNASNGSLATKQDEMLL